MNGHIPFRISAGDHHTVFTADGRKLVNVPCGGMSGITFDEGMVYARWFAAAPDMVAALKGLEGILARAESNASGNPEWEAISARVNAARAAIAKATGAA